MLRFLTSFRLFRPRTDITLELLGTPEAWEDQNAMAFSFVRELLQKDRHITVTVKYSTGEKPD